MRANASLCSCRYPVAFAAIFDILTGQDVVSQGSYVPNLSYSKGMYMYHLG